MNDLNELLKQRAEQKLKKDIGDFILSVRENEFFGAINQLYIQLPDGKKETLGFCFWSEDHPFGKLMFNKSLPRYVALEAKTFMEKVDVLQRDVTDLKIQNRNQ